MIPPKCLRECAQWLNWKNINDNKIPCTKSGAPGKSNDPSTWSTYQSAVRVRSKFSGIAFVFSDDDPYCGIDLDNCLDENGNLLDWARPFVERFTPCSYGEISPSGRGIKFITRGGKPEGSRCVHVIDKNLKQQVEVYDHARFWTITASLWQDCSEISEWQEAVDWVCSEFMLSSDAERLAPSTAPASRVSTSRVVTPDEMELDRRMEAYVDSIPLEAPGGRNNALFKLSGHLHRFVEEGVSPEKVEEYCRYWNNSLLEPLEEEEFLKAVRSGMRNGTPREPKENREQVLPTIPPEVDFSGLKTNSKKPEPVPQRMPRDLIFDAPGMIGDIVCWQDDICLYSLPEVFLASALALMSLITGRKIADPLNGRTNLYLLAMGPTGSGKEHGRQCTKRLFDACGAGDLIAPEDLGSSAGLFARLQEHPATLFQIDEFGKFIEQVSATNAQPYLKALEADLLKLYTSSSSTMKGRAYADTERTPCLDQPHCVILGSSTPSTLWNALSSQSVHAGLLGRLHIFEAPDYVPLTEHVPIGISRRKPPPNLVDLVRFWIEYSPGGNLDDLHPEPTEMIWGQPVQDRLIQHMREIADRRIGEESVAAAIWSRSAEKANKLAMLSAAAKGEFEVTLEDADWAIRLQNFCTRKLVSRIDSNLSDTPYERTKRQVLEKITCRMSLTQLGRKTQTVR